MTEPKRVAEVLGRAVARARGDRAGEPATYIPELANAPLEALSAAITSRDGTVLRAGDDDHRFTFQSSAISRCFHKPTLTKSFILIK